MLKQQASLRGTQAADNRKAGLDREKKWSQGKDIRPSIYSLQRGFASQKDISKNGR